MKQVALLLFLFITSLFTQAQELNLESIWKKYTFFPKHVSDYNWMNDDNYMTSITYGDESTFIIKKHVVSGNVVDTLAAISHAITKSVSGYEFNKNETKILFWYNIEGIYRHSFKAVYGIIDCANGKINIINNGQSVQIPLFSPDGNFLSYFFNNNLYYHDFNTEKEKAITTNGKINHIINGHADWVYEEEFGFTTAYTWSSDSKQIAYISFDESEVKTYDMQVWSDSLYPSLYHYKYPKAGEKNAKVAVYTTDISTQQKQLIFDASTEDMYVPAIKWVGTDQLSVTTFNRLQNHLKIAHVNTNSLNIDYLFEEKSDSYVELPEFHSYLYNNRQMLITSEKSGYRHLYLCDLKTSTERQLTTGDWEISSMNAIDEINGIIYFTAKKESAIRQAVYKLTIENGTIEKLKGQSTTGSYDITLSKNQTFYILKHSSFDTPPSFKLYDKDQVLQKDIITNAGLKATIDKISEGIKKEFFSFVTAEGETLNGWMIKPKNFKANKKYPVIQYVYGGPGIQTVNDQWMYNNYLWFLMLANKGYIVVSVDGRGTGGRGTAFKKATYGNLGDLELKDQIHTANYLMSLKYVDPQRIGIWGWSFGGYLSSLCILKAADVFKMAIAVAPVTSWRFYDTIYTERYLSTPQLNAKGYDDNAPINFASLLKGKYLLIHGTEDDNVHVQHSLQMQKALIDAGKQFDIFLYPDKNHALPGLSTRYHLYQMMTNYIEKNL